MLDLESFVSDVDCPYWTSLSLLLRRGSVWEILQTRRKRKIVVSIIEFLIK